MEDGFLHILRATSAFYVNECFTFFAVGEETIKMYSICLYINLWHEEKYILYNISFLFWWKNYKTIASASSLLSHHIISTGNRDAV